MDDQINERMIELASYSAWYPQLASGRPIQVELELSLPQEWISVCSGRKLEERVDNGRSITRWSSPRDTDIVVLAAPNYTRKRTVQSDISVEVYHTQIPEEFIEREVGQISAVLEFYSNRLGETVVPAGTVKHVYSPKRKGQGGAGISRPGMIVTSEGLTLGSIAEDPEFSLFQGIAHEIAHFWWNFGAGQGDWINESFSEYFSAMAVQKIASEKQFRSALTQYRDYVGELPADAPSLSNVPFLNDRVNYFVRYHKGALMLDSMREILGEDEFFSACRDFFQSFRGKAIGTAEFRSFWKARLAGQKDLVDVWLDSRGGSPSIKE